MTEDRSSLNSLYLNADKLTSEISVVPFYNRKTEYLGFQLDLWTTNCYILHDNLNPLLSVMFISHMKLLKVL